MSLIFSAGAMEAHTKTRKMKKSSGLRIGEEKGDLEEANSMQERL
jgi:hypothetical protein